MQNPKETAAQITTHNRNRQRHIQVAQRDAKQNAHLGGELQQLLATVDKESDSFAFERRLSKPERPIPS
jgi:pyridoxine 5'-phosphate synthase PdxJ